ncbi:MAG: hypothetical protein IJS52_03705 [Bacilli bacterium]|nr:hypothetical protein [Bacilli bacterium]
MILADKSRKLYKETFGSEGTRIFYSHGRLELIGNHTDHQGGACLVSGVNLGITAAVSTNKDGAVRFVSEGYAPFMFHTDELQKKKGELGTTLALCKGVLFKMKEMGYKVGGFTCALVSDLPSGSGLSSSAAVEALICEIVDVLYNKGKMSPMDKAVVSQFAEREYFGKPCGLLDQIGVCYGGVVYVNFNQEGKTYVEPLPYKLTLVPVLVNTGGSHAGLTHLYASIPEDMFSVARNLLGVEKLSDCTMREFLERVCVPCDGVSERAKLRAQHYYDECRRVEDCRKALKEGDSSTFLQSIRMSQESSKGLLGNTMVPGQYQKSPQQAVDIANTIIGKGACRIMGGGFAGSILCFVYPDDLKGFVAGMSKYYGKDAVTPLQIEEGGAKEVR